MRMATPGQTKAESEAWLKPSLEEPALQRYVATIRERKWLIVATVLAVVAAAALYVAATDKVYEAEADLLVTPVSGDDPTLSALGLIRSSSDPTRDVETASRLVANTDTARLVKAGLRDPRPAREVLKDVEVAPVAQSNIVSVTGSGSSPEWAKRIADAFAQQAVAERTKRFHEQVDTALTSLRARAEQSPDASADSTGTDSIDEQITRLESFRSGEDPTLRVETLADLPSDPVKPRPKLTLAAALLGGLLLGVGGAFALQTLDPRLRREEQLRATYGLPILTRVPKDAHSHRDSALAPEELSPATLEAYRTLRASLTASRSGRGASGSVLVTSASPSEGKSTSAINLASSLALAGHRVILIEADLRRPSVAKALGIDAPRHGTGSVLLEMVDLPDALVETKAYGAYLKLLLAEPAGAASGAAADRLFLPAAQSLVDQARSLADYVIVDSPPLTEVIDALPLAQRVDDVLVVVRLGKTPLTRLTQLGELLAQHGIQPVGFAVVGARQTSKEGYYYVPKKTSPPSGRRARSAERETV